MKSCTPSCGSTASVPGTPGSSRGRSTATCGSRTSRRSRSCVRFSTRCGATSRGLRRSARRTRAIRRKSSAPCKPPGATSERAGGGSALEDLYHFFFADRAVLPVLGLVRVHAGALVKVGLVCRFDDRSGFGAEDIVAAAGGERRECEKRS